MASEPLDENQSSRNLVDGRRWGDGLPKVYTRRARRNNGYSSAPASAPAPAPASVEAATPDSNEGCKGNEDRNVLNGNPLEKCLPIPVSEDGNSMQQDPAPQKEPAKPVLRGEDSEREQQEEGAGGYGSVCPDSMDLLRESGEVVVQSESREVEETAELQCSKEALDPMVQLESRGEETLNAENRENGKPEIRENIEPPETLKMVVEPETREPDEPESRVTEEPEISETMEQTNRENMEWEGTELAVEPETREDLEPGGRENVESESREMVVELESREMVGEPDSREMVVEPDSREMVVEPESREMVVELESREAMEQPETREVVLPPAGNGNGPPETNGLLRVQNLRHPQVVEAWPQPPVITRVEDRVRINVSGTRSRDEIGELRRELEAELDQVRSIFKKLEAKELQLTASNRSNLVSNMNNTVDMLNGNNYAPSTFIGVGGGGNFGGYTQPQCISNDFVERRALTTVNSEVGSVAQPETRPFNRSLSVSVVESNHMAGEFVEREKRTPKANQFYRNSEFLLGKDRLPPESNKKLKPNGAGRKHGGDGEYGFGFGYDKQQRERMFRSCSSLLQRLMKHKFDWVFNAPVDAKKLGLHDYHDIIKHPMDLGTIKRRLSQNYYKSPKEFAEDVRLVFHNAMTYNPKGQDVHIMAETLLQIFEERWAVIQTGYNPDWRYQMYHDAGLPTPTSRKAPPMQYYSAPACAPAPITIPITPVPQVRCLDRSESMTTPVDPKLKPFTHVGRTPVLKKPKAKDPNKRDMTYEEKQKLSTNLQGLPSEKLDALVQIIKKRNSTLSQHDDEIEVDIDSVDAETLWELDRFVTNYKKNLSKNKRKAEIALQARALAAQKNPVTNPVPVVSDVQKESRIVENNAPTTQAEKQGDNVSRSSSSSSSSSDSGSSSSDSDSDSSSAYGSDAGRSPRT